MQFSTMVPVFVGLLAIAGAYWNATRLERTKAEFALLNEQLAKLYGPLYALSQASYETWLRFREHNRPQQRYFDAEVPPSEEDLETWRMWMSNVFMPMNEMMVTAIVNNVHLVEGGSLPQSFMDLVAHVEAYRVVKQRWAMGDHSEHVSLLQFPRQFQTDVEETFQVLKARQARLIGTRLISRKPVLPTQSPRPRVPAHATPAPPPAPEG